MTSEIRWSAGAHAIHEQLGAQLLAPTTPIEPIADRPGRRRLFALTTAQGDRVFVKQVLGESGGPLRRTRLALGLDAARREWRALSTLHAAGIPVPKPLAFGTRPGGERVLVTQFVDGNPLNEWLAADPPGAERRAMLIAIGQLIQRFHDTGFVHRDLHWGNLLVARDGPVLVDLQASMRLRSAAARRRDLGVLDDSVSPRLSIADRVRLRAAALGFAHPFDRGEREQLRGVGAASLAAGRRHAASRTRRSLRPGRRFESIRLEAERGMRRRDVADAEVETALRSRSGSGAIDGSQILKGDDRSQVIALSNGNRDWIVKDYRRSGWARRVADVFRGTPARRAWLGGHGLLARGIGAAQPVAFVERVRFGIPVASAIVLEDLRPLESADRAHADSERNRQIMAALARLTIDLHRRGAIHGDLKASHVLLEPVGSKIRGHLIDLEGVRFRRRLSDRDRIHALAQLNASLPDPISAADRIWAFNRYAAAVPFRGDRRRCLERIVEVSLERRHRWTGRDCSLAAAPSTASAPTPEIER